MKQYHRPELEFEALTLTDVLTRSGGGVSTVGPTNPTEPTSTTAPTGTTAPTEPTSAPGGGIVLPEDTFG